MMRRTRQWKDDRKSSVCRGGGSMDAGTLSSVRSNFGRFGMRLDARFADLFFIDGG
jgi:hypothetical protein